MKLRNAVLVLAALAAPALVTAQSRFPGMPGYERFTEMAPQLAQLGRGFSSNVSWSEDSRSVVFVRNGERLSYDLASRQTSAATGAAQGRGRGFGPARGRQAEEAASPDGVHKAIYRDRNIFVSRMDGSAEAQVTTDGSEADRIKYGTASWVYGEELGQVTAMWWSPDGSKLAFYRFDETPVQDFFLQMTQTEIQSSLDIEAYPKAGTDNPLWTSLSTMSRAARRRTLTRVADFPSPTTWSATTSTRLRGHLMDRKSRSTARTVART